MIFGILLIVIEDDIDENGTSKLMPFTRKEKNYLPRATYMILNQNSKI